MIAQVDKKSSRIVHPIRRIVNYAPFSLLDKTAG